jgi:tetratricopeptide (TPR) repeat protein
MLGNKGSQASTLNSLGVVARYQVDTARATEFLEASLALRRELGDRPGMSSALSNLGLVALDGGDPERAEAYFSESLELDRERGNPWGIAASLVNLAYVVQVRGHPARAQKLLAESLTLFQDVGDTDGIAAALEGIAIALGAQRPEPKEAQRAARLFGAAEVLRESIGSPLSEADRPYYEQGVQQLRALLDEATFAAAWAKGRTMALAQAITDALEEAS